MIKYNICGVIFGICLSFFLFYIFFVNKIEYNGYVCFDILIVYVYYFNGG